MSRCQLFLLFVCFILYMFICENVDLTYVVLLFITLSNLKYVYTFFHIYG